MVDFAFQCRLYGLIPGWGAKIPHASVSKDPEDRSNIVTKSIKTFKMVHIKKKLKQVKWITMSLLQYIQNVSIFFSMQVTRYFTFFLLFHTNSLTSCVCLYFQHISWISHIPQKPHVASGHHTGQYTFCYFCHRPKVLNSYSYESLKTIMDPLIP